MQLSLQREHRIRIGALLVLSLLAGCAPRGVGTPVSADRGGRAQVDVAHLTDTDAAIVHIHSEPLYRQARSACQQRQYKRAADLLASLATQPGLNATEIGLVQQQRAVCLKDAGFATPNLTVVAYHPNKTNPNKANPNKANPNKANSNKANSSDALQAATPHTPSADCGPRALALVCAQFHVHTDLATLCQKAGTTEQGTSLAGLALAAKAVGLKTEGVQASREALKDVRLPAIAYVNGNHFIAVLSLHGSGEDATATVHDPNQPTEQTIPQERLLRLSSGYLLSVW